MIGSHDSFTCLAPQCKAYNAGKRWWKTQKVSLQEQYDLGVRLFDIRVCLKEGLWRPCHGLVNLTASFSSLEGICKFMDTYLPDAIYRIVLEKGDVVEEWQFRNQSSGLCSKYPHLWRLDIKASKNWMGAVANNNDPLYREGYAFAKVNVWESPAQELHGFVTKKNWWKINLEKEAKKINGSLFKTEKELQEAVASKKSLYFIDFVDTLPWKK